jgi:hypothetical protein
MEELVSMLIAENFLGFLVAGFGFCLIIMYSGIGAGVIVVPVLISFFAIDPVIAVGTGSAFAFMAKILISLVHAKQKQIVWGEVWRFLVIAGPITGLIGVWIAFQAVSGKQESVNTVLTLLIVGAGSISLGAMFSSRVRTGFQRLPGYILSGATGAMMGFTGIGGGILVIPALTASRGLSIKSAVATSIPIGLALSFILAVILGKNGLLDQQLLLGLVLGTLIGLPVGRIGYKYVREKTVFLLVAVLIALAISGAVYNLLNTILSE